MSQEQKEEKKKGKGKTLIVVILTAALAIGASVGFYFVRQGANYFVTDNARVTTTLIAVTPDVPGILERFTIYEGRYVAQNEVLGWVENGEAMRSPVNGLVVHTSAVQNQTVSPVEPVAVIADTGNLHIQANVEETDIARIRLGQRVAVTIDTFGRRQFSGYVREIGSVTAAELTGNALFFNTGGTFTRVTHLIPVKINIIDYINLDSLIGVNARVRISLDAPDADTALSVSRTPSIETRSITVRGMVESIQHRNIYSALGYNVRRIYAEEGDAVTAGQVLGVLDTEDLEIQLANAEAALQIAVINVASAEHNYGIMRTLYEARAVARNDMLQAEFALQSAIAFRQQAQAMLDAARIAMERSVITAPISGTVTAVIAREGAPGLGLLFTVQDDSLKITTSFREYDLGRIAAGMAVAISSDAAGSAVYTGVISRINPAAAVAAPVVQFEAEVLVTSLDTSLRIGMNVRLAVRLD